MTGPGPKDPPFFQGALEAVERAIAPEAEAVAQDVNPSTITQSFTGATIADVVAKAHAHEREAFEATRSAELAAANALATIEAELGQHVKVLGCRFPSLVSDFRAALSRL